MRHRIRRNPAGQTLIVERYVLRAMRTTSLQLTDGEDEALFLTRTRGDRVLGSVELYLWHAIEKQPGTYPYSDWYSSVAAVQQRNGQLRWGRAGTRQVVSGRVGWQIVAAVEPLIDWFLTRVEERLPDGEYTVRDAPLWTIAEAAAGR